MKLMQVDEKDITVKFSKEEFSDIISAFNSVKMDYDNTDLSVVQMTERRVYEMIDLLNLTIKQIPDLLAGKTLHKRS